MNRDWHLRLARPDDADHWPPTERAAAQMFGHVPGLEALDLDRAWHPEDLRRLDRKELEQLVQSRQQERRELQAQIGKLSAARAEYLDKERKRLATSAKGDSFDEKVAATISEQAARKGIIYGK